MSKYQEDYMRAKIPLEKALLYDTHAQYYTTLARAQFWLGEHTEAHKNLQLALDRDKTYTAAQELKDGLSRITTAQQRPTALPNFTPWLIFGAIACFFGGVLLAPAGFPVQAALVLFLGTPLCGALAYVSYIFRDDAPTAGLDFLNFFHGRGSLPSEVFHSPTYNAQVHLARVKALYETYPFKTEEDCEKHTLELAKRILQPLKTLPSEAICDEIGSSIYDVFKTEGFYERSLPFVLDTASPSYNRIITRPDLSREERFLSEAPTAVAAMEEQLVTLFGSYLKFSPPSIHIEDIGQSPKVFAIELTPHPREFIHHFISFTFDNEKYFPTLYQKILDNVLEVSKLKIEQLPEKRDKLVFPVQHDGTPIEIATAYLKDTPYIDLLMTPVPFAIPERTRFEHTAIIASPGWGKTQLLQSIIAADLEKDDPPSLIVIDSTGAIIECVQRLAVFNDRLKDRILILDPAYSPSLNMFDISTPRFKAYSEDEKENVQTEIIALFNYIFASADYDLSSQMGVAFAYAVRLILSRKGSTITDLRRLLEETPKTYADSAYRDDIEQLDPDAIDFFKTHFFAESVRATRASIARRIHALVAIPAFRRMFTAATNSVDLFDEMNKGTTILVNTNINLLKEDGMVLFGRYVIARALAAAFERSTIPQGRRKPTFLIVDEAAPYFDETFEKLLSRVRQFNLGVVIAFQNLAQADEKIKAAIVSNTSIKYAGGLAFRDRRWLAQDMETTPEFIAAQRKDNAERPEWTQFALFVRNHTEKALSVFLPFYQLEQLPQMTKEEQQELLAHNKERLSSVVSQPDKPPEPPSTPPAAPPAASGDKAAAAPREAGKEQPPISDHNEPATKW
jgi:tetratricopeptide (TPR) repeat protein